MNTIGTSLILFLSLAANSTVSAASVLTGNVNIGPTEGPDESFWTPVGWSSEVIRCIDNYDGYTNYFYTQYRAPFTSVSDLYLFRVQTQFVPGDALNQQDPSYKDYVRLKYGSVKFELNQYKNDNLGQYGCSFVFKDYWPKTQSFETTLTSSYSSTYSASFLANFSAEGGYDSGDGASIKGGLGVDGEYEFQITQSQSVTTSSSDPLVSAQLGPGNPNNTVSWNFTVLNREVSGRTSFNLDSYYLVEAKKDAINLPDYAFHFVLSITSQGQWYGTDWTHWIADWHDAEKFSYGVGIVPSL